MASIFDFLQPSAASQQPAPPATLFDLLRRSALAQQPSYGGATTDGQQAQYAPQQAPQGPPAPVASTDQPSPLDTARWPFGPIGAPSQAMAQGPMPTAPTAPVVPSLPSSAPSGGGFFGNLMTGIQALKGGGGISDAIAGIATGQRTDPAGKAIQAQNQTAKALVAKGVDPQIAMAAINSPDLMKALISHHFGTGQVQNLGNGYVWQNGKAVRAYEPEDKTPPGFEKLDGGGMRPIPGGPADPAYIQKKDANSSSSLTSQVEERKLIAERMNMKPDDPRYTSFITTGKMPREDAQPLTATDKKAILEADEGVLNTQGAITALTEAQKISPKAHTGYLASQRASIGNSLPDWMVPDVIASPESSKDTANYENLVLGQALSQLKSTFGAAPTEGERKILLDLQASATLPVAVRQEILTRAIALANNRLKFNQQRADELRGNTFYKKKPGDGQAPSANTTSSGVAWSVQ